MTYLLGVDLGTSGTKTVLFDVEGREIASQSVEYPLYQPQNGWAEQNPEDWYQAAVQTLQQVADVSYIDAAAIARQIGSDRVMNIVLMGTIIKSMDLDSVDWESIIRENVKPAFVDLNLQAIAAGMAAV